MDADCVCTDSSLDESEDGLGGDTTGTDETQDTYAFVLVEDLTDPVAGDSPGADLDAISVTIDGVERFATSVEDFNLGSNNNNYLNVNEVLGQPDSGCTKQNFVSLGGAQQSGFIIVGFANSETDAFFTSGDTVTVYELGPTTCPSQPNWDDDPYSVGVSISTDRGSFTEIGYAGLGNNTLIVP
ncbi:MAG: hypothetical protein AAFX99_04850 [Myxococcota bacterium]